MLDKDNWQEIFATIKKNKLRTFLTCLGVGWGIFMLVIMLGAGNGLKNGIMQDFSGMAKNSFFVWAQPTTKAYKGMKPGRHYHFNNGDTEALSRVKELAVVSPQCGFDDRDTAVVITRGLKTGNFLLTGNFPNLKQIREVVIQEGRFLNNFDISEKRKICIIGKAAKEALYKPGEKIIGSYISINGIFFNVVGLTKPTGSGNKAREESLQIIIPFPTFQKTFNWGNALGNFAIAAHPLVPTEDAEKAAIAALKERHKIAPDDEMAVGHWNLSREFKRVMGLFSGINMIVWFVGIGTLLAGIIGISNIMLIVVKERTREIGVKRALGATPANVIRQILLESVFLTSIAGYLGLLVGLLLLQAINSAIGEGAPMFKNPSVDLVITFKALSIMIFAGAAAGFIPAMRAVSVNPVEALRAE